MGPKNNTRSSSASNISALEEQIQQAVQAAIGPLISQINNLEQKLAERDTQIYTLEKKVVDLETDVDSLEQYGRRMNFRVENVPYDEGETNDSLKQKVINIMQEAGADISAKDIVRHHRSNKLQTAANNVSTDRQQRGAGKYSQVIVKVNNWRARESAHLSRNTARGKGHPIKQDLTARRRELIAKANDTIISWGDLPTPVFCYANINCEPTIRRGREVKKFTSIDSMNVALEHFRPA
jgi:septal ring factor EnvC (AmiA/AmiB activator)